MNCGSCGITFQSATELEKTVKKCPQCIEKAQDEMLGIIFGKPNVSIKTSKNGSKKSKAKIFPSLLNKDPLSVAEFKTIQERNMYVVTIIFYTVNIEEPITFKIVLERVR